MVDQAIWSKKMSNGTRRIPVSPEQVQSQLLRFVLLPQLLYHNAIVCSPYFIMQTQDEISLK